MSVTNPMTCLLRSKFSWKFIGSREKEVLVTRVQTPDDQMFVTKVVDEELRYTTVEMEERKNGTILSFFKIFNKMFVSGYKL